MVLSVTATGVTIPIFFYFNGGKWFLNVQTFENHLRLFLKHNNQSEYSDHLKKLKCRLKLSNFGKYFHLMSLENKWFKIPICDLTAI